MRSSAPRAVLRVPSSRRALLRAAGGTALGASTALLSACGSRRVKSAPIDTPGARTSALHADIGVLNAALDLEHRAIAAYTAGIPLLSGAALAVAQQFLAQEFAHAAELSALIRARAGKAQLPAAAYDLGQPRTAKDVLSLLHEIEAKKIGAYLDAIATLTPGGVRSTVASILANEAQHVSYLRVRLGRPAVLSAFVSTVE